MQARGMFLQSNDPQSFNIMMIDFDYSSKLCFEEKSNSVICDKMFKKSRKLIPSGAVMIPVTRCSDMQSLQKVSNISLFDPKFQRKSENQGYIKISEKVLNRTLEKWVFLKSKFKT